MPRPLAPKGGNDRIYTPPELAKKIVAHFRPSGDMLEPCSGRGAFVEALKGQGQSVSYCEIDQGIDFMDWSYKVDWIVTNPPYSLFRDFLKKSMEVSDNVVFLCFTNAWYMKARQRDIEEAGFGLVEILHLDHLLLHGRRQASNSALDGSASRLKHAKARGNHDTLAKVFSMVEKSDLLTGRKPSDKYPHWKASIDWVLNPTNWAKIIEGNYTNKPTQTAPNRRSDSANAPGRYD